VLEISILIVLSKYVYRTAEAKGYPGALFIVILVVSWFGGGIVGGVIGMMETGGEDEFLPFGAIIGYLVGVGVAGMINYTVVSSLPGATAARPNPSYERQRQREWEEMEYVERRRRGEVPAEEGEVVPLAAVQTKVATGTDTPLPVAKRAEKGWKRKWNN
jgi:hypothetical protein